jgi:hypothetical protein
MKQELTYWTVKFDGSDLVREIYKGKMSVFFIHDLVDIFLFGDTNTVASIGRKGFTVYGEPWAESVCIVGPLTTRMTLRYVGSILTDISYLHDNLQQ